MSEKIGSIPPFGLRLPSTVKEWVSEQAAKQDRSMNYVILKILEKAMMVEEAREIWGDEAAGQLAQMTAGHVASETDPAVIERTDALQGVNPSTRY